MAVSPPQLPPLRSLGFYPSYVSAQMAPLTLPTGFDSDSDAVTALSSRKLSRPLPRIPDPSITPARQYTLQSNSAAPPSNEPPQSSSKVTNTSTARARVLSSFMPRTSSSTSTLLATLQHPAILASLAAHLDWADLLPLLSTAKSFRLLFADPALRDVVLARFVPGYARCVRHRDLAHYQDVHVSIHDLDLLLISQRVGLHRYPMHALRSLTSLYPTPEDDDMSSKLIALTQAHSRFVLLLQSLVHSSNEPMPLEPEEIKWKSRFQPVQNLRELTFPSPLAYTQATPPSPPPKSGTTPALVPKRPSHKLSRSQPINSPHLTSSAHTPLDFAPHPTLYSMKVGHGPRPSANSLSSMMSNASHPSSKKGRRLSLFGKSSYNTPLPPPPEEPRALKTYSSTWRRSVYPVDGADENGCALKRFGTNASSDSSISGGGCASMLHTPRAPLLLLTSSLVINNSSYHVYNKRPEMTSPLFVMSKKTEI
ncbi:hypothetical protein B0H34DRAFT_801609 [Crassisporium funariophilum]|nr:hypothetical protein B0H34DRAFT_801609 [Crassisporium funariophilum]